MSGIEFCVNVFMWQLSVVTHLRIPFIFTMTYAAASHNNLVTIEFRYVSWKIVLYRKRTNFAYDFNRQHSYFKCRCCFNSPIIPWISKLDSSISATKNLNRATSRLAVVATQWWFAPFGLLVKQASQDWRSWNKSARTARVVCVFTNMCSLFVNVRCN